MKSKWRQEEGDCRGAFKELDPEKIDYCLLLFLVVVCTFLYHYPFTRLTIVNSRPEGNVMRLGLVPISATGWLCLSLVVKGAYVCVWSWYSSVSMRTHTIQDMADMTPHIGLHVCHQRIKLDSLQV